jgi:hypothetical protein
MNYIKKIFGRSRSYPGCIPKNIPDKHEIDDLMEVRVCTASYCATCEEMVFQTLRKCKECNERKICYICYEDNRLCKECYQNFMYLYNTIEIFKTQPIKNINNYVDQLL